MNPPSLLGTDASQPARAIPVPGQRIEGDAYYTPDALARAIVAELLPAGLAASAVWEPHAGGGAFVRALRDAGAVVYASDLDPDAAGLAAEAGAWGRWPGHDFLSSPSPFRGAGPEWILGNPPFDQAEAHVRRALALSRRHVVFLLRLAFVETQRRIPFWTSNPARHIWMLGERPSFTGGVGKKGRAIKGNTDGCPYGVFWWDLAQSSPTTCTPGWNWKGAPR